MTWTVIIPVKPAATGKSRLGLGPELARAIALDTVAAVLASDAVTRVIVVTADATFRPDGVEVVAESAPAGIDAAVEKTASIAGDGYRAALLGDLPALRPAELTAALAAAARHPAAFVADREGVGTTFVTAAPGVPLVTAFGADSAARHASLGLVRLEPPVGSSVNMDVDTVEQLERARSAGLGPSTTAALSRRVA